MDINIDLDSVAAWESRLINFRAGGGYAPRAD